MFDVHRSAFTPPPKITSAIVQLVPKMPAIACNVKVLERVTAAAFGQRRKMLRQSLKAVFGVPEEILSRLALRQRRAPKNSQLMISQGWRKTPDGGPCGGL